MSSIFELGRTLRYLSPVMDSLSYGPSSRTMSLTDQQFVKSPVTERKLGADFDSLSSVRYHMAKFRLCKLSFKREHALTVPKSILGWLCTSIKLLQTHYGSCLSTIKSIHQTDNEEDAIAVVLLDNHQSLA